jgi:hypothetical protein
MRGKLPSIAIPSLLTIPNQNSTTDTIPTINGGVRKILFEFLLLFLIDISPCCLLFHQTNSHLTPIKNVFLFCLDTPRIGISEFRRYTTGTVQGID